MIQNFNTGYHPSLFKPKPHVFISVFHADNSFKIYNQNIRALLNTGADKYIFEALALGQVAQQNLLALPSNLLALL